VKRIEPLKIKISPSDSRGIFHDSRRDVKILGDALNVIIKKQNEIIQAINILIDRED
jgi:hypothetical protein